MTEIEAKKLGYIISRGSYVGTNDDRVDRWYINKMSSNLVDRRGPGFATKKEALEELDLMLR